MSKIDRRFLADLFKNRDVAYHSTIYKKLYYYIWPCETFFKEFLTATDPSVRLDFAKKIYTYIQAEDDVFLPTYMVNDVISFQLYHLKDSQDGYVPQDHVIHSVNLYILGIYLFFNMSSFHQKILESTVADESLYEEIITFVKKWRAFALYHDVGYFFEGNVNKSGEIVRGTANILGEYNKLTEQILYHYTTRSVARLLLIEALMHKSVRPFDSSQISSLHKGQWVTYNNASVDATIIDLALEQFNTAKFISSISSFEAFSGLISLCVNESFLSIIYDQDGQLKGMMIYKDNRLSDGFFQNTATAERLNINEGDAADIIHCRLPAEWTCRYVVPNIEKIIQDYSAREYAATVNEFYEYLPESLRLAFSMAATDQKVNECYYDTMLWLRNKSKHFLPDCSKEHDFLDMYTSCMSDYIKGSLSDAICDWVNKSVADKTLKLDSLEKELNRLAGNLKTNASVTQIAENTKSSAVQTYNANNGISLDITHYYENLYRLTYAHLHDSKVADGLSRLRFITSKADGEISIDVFAHKKNPNGNSYEARLYRQLHKLAEQLNIKFEDLKNYRPPHSRCDHGVISAGLLYQATIICCYLAEYSEQKKNLRLAWRNFINSERMTNDAFMNQYSEVIFAILLHNIYTKKSSPEYGVSYKQNINANPFSFFCAFCDLLQKWNRPKQLNLAHVELPSEHYLGDDFDIEIVNDKIALRCSPIEANAIRSEFQSAEQYLPGSSILISL